MKDPGELDSLMDTGEYEESTAKDLVWDGMFQVPAMIRRAMLDELGLESIDRLFEDIPREVRIKVSSICLNPYLKWNWYGICGR